MKKERSHEADVLTLAHGLFYRNTEQKVIRQLQGRHSFEM
jgi:hypothetical protein